MDVDSTLSFWWSLFAPPSVNKRLWPYDAGVGSGPDSDPEPCARDMASETLPHHEERRWVQEVQRRWGCPESMGDDEAGCDRDKDLPRGMKFDLRRRHDYSTFALAITGFRWQWA
jgi:hypothetical protein